MALCSFLVWGGLLDTGSRPNWFDKGSTPKIEQQPLNLHCNSLTNEIMQPDPVPADGNWSLETLKFAPISLNPDVAAVIAGFDINISFNKE